MVHLLFFDNDTRDVFRQSMNDIAHHNLMTSCLRTSMQCFTADGGQR